MGNTNQPKKMIALTQTDNLFLTITGAWLSVFASTVIREEGIFTIFINVFIPALSALFYCVARTKGRTNFNSQVFGSLLGTNRIIKKIRSIIFDYSRSIFIFSAIFSCIIFIRIEITYSLVWLFILVIWLISDFVFIEETNL
ncbi:MAG: hypothetical protein FWD48_01140 [Oscillospiraceae bacterium]|nr:hypothetical protein [Oscillospiraceae bacterium]